MWPLPGNAYHRALHASKLWAFALVARKVGARCMLPAVCQTLRQTCTMCLGDDQKTASWCMISSLQSGCWRGSEHIQDMPYAHHLDMELADGLPSGSNVCPVSMSKTWLRCTPRSKCWQKTLRHTWNMAVVAAKLSGEGPRCQGLAPPPWPPPPATSRPGPPEALLHASRCLYQTPGDFEKSGWAGMPKDYQQKLDHVLHAQCS